LLSAAAAGNAPVGAFALGDERLPFGVEGIDLEPAGDGHAAAGELELVLVATGDFDELIFAVEFDRLPKPALPSTNGMGAVPRAVPWKSLMESKRCPSKLQ
jgi:hypothetical protein